jgi:hypothetical protein
VFSKRKLSIAVFGIALILAQAPALAQPDAAASPPLPPPTQAELDAARHQAEDNPANAKLKYDYGELLRRSGDVKTASREYLLATEIDASYLLAYHQLALNCTDATLVAEAVKRLQHLKEQHQDDLMIRVALSELLENQGKYYDASRILVELVFKNVVPVKYTTKLNSRILFLQAKARAQHIDRGAHEGHHGTGKVENVDSVPVPLPEESLNSGLKASRLEPSTQGESFGHARLDH